MTIINLSPLDCSVSSNRVRACCPKHHLHSGAVIRLRSQSLCGSSVQILLNTECGSQSRSCLTRKAKLDYNLLMRSPSATGSRMDGSVEYFANSAHKTKEPEKYQLSPDETEPHDWLMLLCMAFSDGDTSSCFDWKELASLRPFTWVSLTHKRDYDRIHQSQRMRVKKPGIL
ncbi:hypothetical protein HNY73_021693 [Argiope bruennichi]|uniref:Uncharacterized protein n=1 Tax=Argiope bruennichi TaxID=94029 RepID=A0A8T0DYE1_ARGBR|nr:hypothetical protein HNY73_021693 [Argiope bruennichi]